MFILNPAFVNDVARIKDRTCMKTVLIVVINKFYDHQDHQEKLFECQIKGNIYK